MLPCKFDRREKGKGDIIKLLTNNPLRLALATKTYYQSDAGGQSFLSEVKELYRYRYLLRLMVRSKLITRYKRSVLGILWTLINPLLRIQAVVQRV